MKKILVAAGGTGGHLFPAIAVIEELKSRHKNNIDFEFFGRNDKIEGRVVPEMGYKLHSVNLTGISGNKISLSTLTSIFNIIISVRKSIKIIKNSQIDAVLCAGAYLSISPGIAAKLCNKKLFLMESNVNLGKANRFLADRADMIFTSFEETQNIISHLDSKKIKFTGNPVRQSILAPQNRLEAIKKLNLKEDKPTVLIFGGSLGAKSINEAVLKHINNFVNTHYQVLWQCGDVHKFDISLPENIKLVNFIDDMAAAYAAADLVVSRSGATTVAELCVTGKPSILVPLPSASNNEQMLNAKILEKAGASVLINNSDINNKLFEVVDALILNSDKLDEMRKSALKLANPDASKFISDEIEKVLF